MFSVRQTIRKSTFGVEGNGIATEDAEKSPEILIKDARQLLRVYEATPLSSSDKVMAMQGWNKALAFPDSFSEALTCHWRLLVATDFIGDPREGIKLFEHNADPIALALQDRIHDFQELILGLIDGAIRSLCPDKQIVLRESYRPIRESVAINKLLNQETVLSLECETVKDYLRLFARLGFLPHYWCLFVESFSWTCKTHIHYAKDDDFEDLERGKESAYARAIALTVALPAIEEWKRLKDMASNPAIKIIANMFSRRSVSERLMLGECFYRKLLTDYPDLLDYFAETNMNALSGHLVQSLDLCFHAAPEFGDANSYYRKTVNHLGNVHRRMGVATFNYPLVGTTLLEVLNDWFDDEVKYLAEQGQTIEKAALRQSLFDLYVEVMSLVYYPMLRQEKLIAEAHEFYATLKNELKWSEADLSRRMSEIEQEIHLTGRYEQKAEEVEIGCRLAWRNSNKCIGRISWNTLMVRDKRHLCNPEEIFEDLQTHLKIATAGTNIQSVMTIYAAKRSNEPLGTRFWSSQLVRYACYKNKETGDLLGDPANLHITEYLIEKNLWKPPEPRGRFDVLPLVLKVPGIELPYVHQLPQEVVYEVDIEHPAIPEFKTLGYRWCTVPAITNFTVNLGGMIYQNNPFNGWFMSTEIVRNFLERINVGEEIAKLLRLDVTTNPLWRHRVAYELELAIIHSFRKNNFTIVDPHGVGESFCVHVRRERELHGRECPGQWSWIGGFVGHTNPTWHLEMRDFLQKPQYGYTGEGLLVHESVLALTGAEKEKDGSTGALTRAESQDSFSFPDLPRVLILFGSETGNSEAAARMLKSLLRPLKPHLCSLNDAAGLELLSKRKITHVLCVCSTFGEGGAPSNATLFFETPFVSDLPEDIMYAVLALGSTLYPDFCKAGRKLDEMFSEAGMQSLADISTVNEVTGAKEAINQWLNLIKTRILPPYLEEKLAATGDVSTKAPINVFTWLYENVKPKVNYDKALGSMCLSSKELVPDTSKTSNSTKQITFDVPADSSYESGDHLSVRPLNLNSMVKGILNCFKKELVKYARHSGKVHNLSDDEALEWQSQQCFELSCAEGNDISPSDVFFAMPTTLHDVLSTTLDLSLGERNVTELVGFLKGRLDEVIDTLDASKAEDSLVLGHPLVKDFTELSSKLLTPSKGKEDSDGTVEFLAQFPNICVLFQYFGDLFVEPFVASTLGRPDAEPLVSLAEVLVRMPRLQQRMYSISSTNKTNPNEVSISVGLLKTSTSKGVPIQGVCSHFLHSLVPNQDRAIIAIRKSGFRLPAALDCPLIMVGAGTGIAPMIGFLEERYIEKQNGGECGPIHVFFGCRTESDFIYKDLINHYVESGLIVLHLALSRSKDAPKAYVQDKMAAWGNDACDFLLNPKSHFYVCGDASMADCCLGACANILRKHAKMSRITAVHYLEKMRVGGRWQLDVWGIISHFEDAKKAANRNKKQAAKLWLQQSAMMDQ